MIRNVDFGASRKLSSAIASSTFRIESQSSSFPNPRVPSHPSPPPLLPLCIGIHSAPWGMGAMKNQGGKAFNIQQFDCRKLSAQRSVYLFYMSVQFSCSVVSNFCDPTDCSRPLMTHTCERDTHTLKGRSGSVSVESPGEHRFCLSRPSTSGRYGF